MSQAKIGTLSYEETPIKISRSSTGKIRSKETARVLDGINTSTIVWHLIKRHKFALLATFTAIYVTFTLFGTLIVGLVQSF